METQNDNSLILLTDPERAEIAMNSIAGLPEVLAQNQSIVDKAHAHVNKLLERVKTEGMSDELDTLLNDNLVKFRARKAEMLERRMPATKWWNDFVLKRFTSLESLMDTGVDTPAGKMQKHRNDYAVFKIEEKKKADTALKLKQDTENERIRIKSDVQKQFNDYSSNYQLGKIRDLTNIFEAQTLEFFERAHLPINEFPDHPSKTKDFDFKYKLTVAFVKDEEAGEIADKEFASLKITFGRTFMEAIKAKKAELIEKLPGKKKELEEIAAAAERKRLADEDAKRAQGEAAQRAAKEAQDKAAAEEKRLAEEAETRKANEELLQKQNAEKERLAIEAKATEQASVEQAVISFDVQMEGATAAPTKGAGTVKEEIVITVLSSAGWLQIINYYFKHEGLSLNVDDLSGKKLDSMLKFAQKNADNSKMGRIESDLIKYSTAVKTSARKA